MSSGGERASVSPARRALSCPICGSPSAPEDRFGPAPLRRCSACGHTYLDREVDPDLYRDSYFQSYSDGDYLANEERRRHESRLRLDLLATVVPSPARVLEIGSAAGFFLDEARKRGYAGVGVEPNAAMASYAQHKLGLDVRGASLGNCELDAGTFDAACAFHVIEHLAEPLASLQTICEAVKPQGFLLVEVPNAESAAAQRRGSAWAPLELPYHVGHFGVRSLSALLERAGFEIVTIHTVPFAVYGPSSRLLSFVVGLAEALRAGALLPARAHPSGHQLLRAVARRVPT